MAVLPNGLATGIFEEPFYSHKLNQSARISKADSASIKMPYSSKGTATDLLKFTFSGWVKRGAVGDSTFHPIITAGNGALQCSIVFTNVDRIEYIQRYSSNIVGSHYTTAVFRDPSAWYHVVVAYDAANATAADRCKIYVNGILQDITVNNAIETTRETRFTNNGNTVDDVWMGYGFRAGTAYYSEMYRAEFHMIDGQTLDPTYFGEWKNDIWIPKAYSGTYGNNGFYIDFSDVTASAGSITSVNDSGPNGLDFSVVSSVEVSDIVPDSPTNNFCTLNSVYHFDGGAYLSEGNLKYDKAGTGWTNSPVGAATFWPSSGKWYWEFLCTSTGPTPAVHIGVCNSDCNGYDGYDLFSYYSNTGNYFYDPNGTVSYGATWGANDIIGVAYDADNGTIEFYKNGTSQGQKTGLFPLGELVPCAIAYYTADEGVFNFGQDSTFAGSVSAGGNTDANGIGDFKYGVPDGHLALCTSNLPNPVFNPAEGGIAGNNFDVVTYTGTGAAQLVGDIVREVPDEYPINNSLRFDSTSDSNLTWTPSAAGDQKTWTYSVWFKRGKTPWPDYATLLYVQDGSWSSGITMGGDGNLLGVAYFQGAWYVEMRSGDDLNDPNQWYHVTLAYDSTQTTESDRVKLWVNGVRVTNWGNEQYPALNGTTHINSGLTHTIGSLNSSGGYEFDGCMAEIHFIDGTAYDADTFGAFDGNGAWYPITPSVTYGSNGFHLDFADSAAIGDDNSGNTNDWTANNLAATDVTIDTPTNSFQTLDPTTGYYTSREFFDSNLRILNSHYPNYHCWGTGQAIPKTGKWYWEVYSVAGGIGTGMAPYDYDLHSAWTSSSSIYGGLGAKEFNWYAQYTVNNNRFNTLYATAAPDTGDIVGVYFNADEGYLGYTLNGVDQGIAFGINAVSNNSSTDNNFRIDTSIHYQPVVSLYTSQHACYNFGQDSSFAGYKTTGSADASDANSKGSFYYTPPTGYLALCEDNIAPYNDLTNVESPDFVWIKERSPNARSHVVYDSVRGARGEQALHTDLTSAEGANHDLTELMSFNKNGFVIGRSDNGGTDLTNQAGSDYVAWMWKGGTQASNTNGTITSTVSANTDAGFSIVSFTAASASDTVGHGLNQKPEIFIIKHRGTTYNWWTGIGGITGTDDDYVALNLTSAKGNSGHAIRASDTLLTLSSNFTGGSGDHIAYCFHSVDGFSKVGSYVGNGSSTDGTFVYTGFRPKWVMIKQISTAENWIIIDAERNAYNLSGTRLIPNLANAEANDNGLDLLSNGFKARSSNTATNESGQTHVYIAFADQPMKFSNAR